MQTDVQEATGGRIIRQALCDGARSPARPSPATAPSTLALPALLTDEQAAAFMGISKRKFHELRNEPWMPRPIVLGPRLVRWSRAELDHAVASMPRQEHASEPAQLRRGRIEAMKRGGK